MFTLSFVDRIDIKNKDEDLTEPSGVALKHDGSALWVVSDNVGRIYELGLDGEISRSFDIEAKDLEGITAGPDDPIVFAVSESGDRVLKIDIRQKAVVEDKQLEDMEGYDRIRDVIAAGDADRGLEGITWNGDAGTLLCLREAEPGLLIEIAADLQSIRGHTNLDEDEDFLESDDEIDFSGIAYDPKRKACWIVSHQARRVFLYALDDNRVLDSARLTFRKNGEEKKVKQVEGVAIDTRKGRLYTVCDDASDLYIHDIVDS